MPAEATRPLRLAVLRPGQPARTAHYEGDDDPATAHFGAFDPVGELIAVASLYAETRGGGPAPGWRLRGMAAAPTHRGRGAGRAVLDACLAHARGEGGAEVWCNARLVAVGFYRAAGFEVVGDEFEIAGIGPHHVMRVVLDRR